MHRMTVWPTIVAGLVITSPVVAQKVPERTLAKPEAEFAEPFSDVTAIRELRDGRVIVVDGRELKAQVVDFRAGTVSTIGRNGEGPGEYRWPRQLFALPGDSSLLPEQAGGRLLIITPDAKPGDFLNLDPPDAAIGRRFLPRFSDALGRLYTEAQPIGIGADGTAQLVDSSAIERLDRKSGRRDTVAFVPLRKDAGAQLRNGMVFTMPRRQPFSAWDAWLVAPDGRIALVYFDPYRVDYVAPGRAVTRGKPIPYDRVKVDDALKQQWREERQRPSMAMIASRGGPTTIGPMKMPYQEPSEWPAFLPPFLPGAQSFSSDGMLWIKRATVAGMAPTFDLIDGKGELVERVVLPQRSKLVGFGNRTLYVVRLDDDELQYLQRYRLGATGRP
jgi:hypothetical protein